MSQDNLEKIVEEYIKNIKDKLPEWLKEDKEELKIMLSEIEDHIWDKAEELSENGVPTESSIRLALDNMGTPERITKEYKRRGTPKVYITEDLWPLYTRVLGILFSVVIVVYIVFTIINIITGNFYLDFVGFFLGLTSVFTIVTLIFVALSLEGYLPEDLKSPEERKKAKKDWPISPKTGKPLKPFLVPTGMIVGGIIQMAIGLIFVIQPETPLTHLIEPEFLTILRIFGLFVISQGCIDLIRGIIGNQQITSHQIMIGVKIFLSIMGIPLLVILMERPELVPFIPFEDWIISGFFGFVIFMVIIGAISDTYKAVTLEKYRGINYKNR